MQQPNNPKEKKKEPAHWYSRRWFVVSVSIVIATIALWLVIKGLIRLSHSLTATADPTQFVIGSLLSWKV